MDFCVFGPLGNVVRVAVAACLRPTTFELGHGLVIGRVKFGVWGVDLPGLVSRLENAPGGPPEGPSGTLGCLLRRRSRGPINVTNGPRVGGGTPPPRYII